MCLFYCDWIIICEVTITSDPNAFCLYEELCFVKLSCIFFYVVNVRSRAYTWSDTYEITS